MRKMNLRSLLASVCLMLASCGDPGPPGEPGAETLPDRSGPATPAAGTETVTVFFTREEFQVGVVRPVPQGAVAGPETALRILLQGPGEDEALLGLTSWFSGDTADALRSFLLGPDGHLVVDFHDLSPVIPGASSSFGSAMLLAELNRTLFEFEEVRSVEYRMEGSCERFWNWLQYDCEVIANPG